MPELPEVEIIRRQLSEEIVGKKIVEVAFDTPKMLKPSPPAFKSAVEGRVVSKIDRRAKLLFFHLDNGRVFTNHLKLSGRLLYRPPGHPPDDYTHVVLHFNDGSELRFADARKFGYMELAEASGRKSEVGEIKSKYGPEPLDDLTKDKFYEILQGTRRRVKDVLMDQKLVSGVGNIYANDALWLAQIHPETPANSIEREAADELLDAIEGVLEESLQTGGSSENWYRQIHGEKGHYQDHTKVYQRAGEACARCGAPIEYMKVSQRGTFICPQCQRKD